MQSFERESPDYDGNIEELVPRRTLSDLTAQRAGTLFTERIFSDGTAKRYRTTDPGKESVQNIPTITGSVDFRGQEKTLLLYDLAMKLSVRQRVCMIHCGESGEDWRILHKRLRRIDFLSDRQLSLQTAKQTMTENVCGRSV